MKNNKRSVTFCGSSVHFHTFSLKAKSDLIYCILHFLPERKYWVLSLCVWLLEDMSFILVRNVVIMFISSAVSLCLYLVTAELSLFSQFVVVRWSHGRAEVSLAELVLSVFVVNPWKQLSETHSQLRIHVTAVLELFNISHDLHQQVVTQVICRGTCSLLEYFHFLQLYSYLTSFWRQILYFCTLLHLIDNFCYSLLADSMSRNTLLIHFFIGNLIKTATLKIRKMLNIISDNRSTHIQHIHTVKYMKNLPLPVLFNPTVH